MSRTQVKHFCEYAGSKVKVKLKKGEVLNFDNWVNKDYTIDELIQKKVLSKGFDFDKKIQIKYGNIHEVKGLTFDNVIVDHTLTRREKDWFTQCRLAYTAYSRGVFDYWTLASQRKLTLGER